MKRFKQIIAVICCFITLASCGQDHKKKNMNNSFNKIANLYKEVEHYNIEPEYYIEGYQSGCFYEILVNDVLVFKHYENVGLMNHATPINSRILKSGSQKVTIKLFPLGKIDSKEYTTIDADDSFRLKIFKRDKKQPYEAGDYDIVKEHYATLTDGLPYYEETFTFEAEVPYELKGWSESQVLTEMDQKELEKEVLSYYKDFSKIISKKNSEIWQDKLINREKEIAQANYFKKEDTKEIAEEYLESIKTNFFEMLPIENYELVFYGDGKIVKLESKEHKKESALISIEERDYQGIARKAYIFHGLSLHKLKDSNKLEIIR
ncbi:hypothetical protein [Aquimarina longa]|uniref:hypothetical protein n=1 Tax=Aquimarina longa TaxID=1080221 RepID=UPI0007849D08|nr:hypothetical protein [Aquimarina longa]